MFELLHLLRDADTDDLAELAMLVAPNDPAFFNGAEFHGADLRGTDLSSFQLIGAQFTGARIDDLTVFPLDMPLKLMRNSVSPELQALIVDVRRGIKRDLLPVLASAKNALAYRNPGHSRKAGGRADRSLPPPKNNQDRNFRSASLRRLTGLAELISESFVDDDQISATVVLESMARCMEAAQVCHRLSVGHRARLRTSARSEEKRELAEKQDEPSSPKDFHRVVIDRLFLDFGVLFDRIQPNLGMAEEEFHEAKSSLERTFSLLADIYTYFPVDRSRLDSLKLEYDDD